MIEGQKIGLPGHMYDAVISLLSRQRREFDRDPVAPEMAGPVGPAARNTLSVVLGERRGLFSWQKAQVEAHIFRKDVVFKVKAIGGLKRLPKSRKGTNIRCFSAQSARRLRLLFRNTSDLWTSFVTLTYPGKKSLVWDPAELNGPICKGHIHKFCAWLSRQKISYVWILEFQASGVPHFHFMISGFLSKNKMAVKWDEIVGSGDPNALTQGVFVTGVKDPDLVGSYMGSYLSKLDQKTVPTGFERVGRFWGASRCLAAMTLRMRGLYSDLSEKLAVWTKENQYSRLDIAADQQELAEAHARDMEDPRLSFEKRQWAARTALSCAGRARSYSEPWEWRGYGFTLLRGADNFRAVIRQAVMIDRGLDASGYWEYWDGNPDPKPVYESPAERIAKEGNFGLFGDFYQSYPDLIERRSRPKNNENVHYK